jgi:hypothetical protein
MKLGRNSVFIAGVVVLFSAVAGFGGCPCDREVIVRSVDFPGNHKEDGFWAGMHAGMDHAHFYIYDPAKDKMIHRMDLAKFLGGSGKGIRTHAKVHSKIVEDFEGMIYFATGNMGAGPDEVDPMSWEGGHWIKYDPKEDKLYDLGLVAPHRGIYGLAIDKQRKRLLGICRGGHFMVHDIGTGQTFDMGRVNMYASTCERTVVSDDEGNAYGTFWPDRMFKYDAKTERVLDLSVRLPSDETIYPMTVSIVKRYMRAGVWDDISKKMYGVEGGTSILFEYDPKAGEEGTIKALDRLLPCQQSEEQTKAHYASLNFTLGKDRKIYYMPVGAMKPSDSRKLNEGLDFFRWAGQAYLISYDLESGRKECLGRVYTQDGAKVVDFLNGAPSGGASTGPDGTIYFCSFVEEKNPELVSRYFANVKFGEPGNIPVRMRLLIYKPQK